MKTSTIFGSSGILIILAGLLILLLKDLTLVLSNIVVSPLFDYILLGVFIGGGALACGGALFGGFSE